MIDTVGVTPTNVWRPYRNRIRFRRSDIEEIPTSAYGVYGLWFKRRCLYIGKAKRQPIAKRLDQHWTGTHNPALAAWIRAKGAQLSVSYLVTDRGSEIDQLEKLYIGRFQPLTNKQLK